ncbi:MAG: ribonucleoside-diphosphate reductase subunit alpha [Candidatus Ryanbacteria bacterium RIFCSPHIGHO2_02_FULL_45_43]|uniref:Ribonucleoside-diphosphate reductase n=1 Tax=Candidatus Ryanbacteria bacterium RIFCSPHIGHO2_01_45_13 TaxID=1802112 RepID=A0A1G2FZN5_9BACT|nr:MAG: ribonucleoside-diphosphate reductase subunit alpha [Candidatus Ryanbacteria bacterium RIFCSPHIGHO2_01_FULL_44_130]OGZ43543.1 MAG: ribonucleoside-diphosphate reductase subunit alpha [Candidatus Ryanbacteria bacterium RIFCSPHIGHO2_01_45_13]OGZ47919.1 MAG: ribonucleoside-diphosphate reductase subunit alpha [Candidatus Ryanbacteria bacterium RIFCSPHIGHO2_02_FULL_45_43]OGZ49933.1 MAG: ribonucleoside-diphosphate reductase subunit alpha [Candidatus Ryanbacteria bacterium RIFCSPHIGHO2_12_FULL_44
MRIIKIKKRSGKIEDFNRERIENAIEKACIATATSIEKDMTISITDNVIALLEDTFKEQIPGVENVQDLVEKSLAEHGLFEVAKTYILYREKRADIRESKKQELLDKIEKSDILVKKRDGTVIKFDITQIEIAIKNSCRGYEHLVDIEKILEEVKLNLYDGITTREINKAVIMTMRAHIEEEPAYSFVTARFLWNDLYKDVIGVDEFDKAFTTIYKETFPKKIRQGIKEGKFDKRLLHFDLHYIASHLEPQRDKLFGYLGAQTLYDRYFIKTADGEMLETPQYFWMRIALGTCLNEEQDIAVEHVIAFYNIMSQMIYTPSTPTLFHAGTPKPQLSSCYLNSVSDSLEHIFKTYTDNAQLSKWSGGIGTDWTQVRATGAHIKGTGVESQGVIPFLKIANDVTIAINRSGRRRGATAVYLETWHYDIEDFLELRKNTGDERRRTHDMNTANWIPDLFMKRVKDDGTWTLFSPEETPQLHDLYGKDFEKKYTEYEEKTAKGDIKIYKTIKARDLWKKMLTMLYETGHPWITFKDPSNIRSPQDHAGVVHNSNLCTEITLNTSENETAVCNLGSLNFAKLIKDGKFEIDLVKKVVPIAVRMLDNIIDINYYPTEDARHSNLRHRPIGLGIRGFQDALYMLGIHFDSDQCVRFSDESMEAVAYYAYKASAELARERGAYESFQGSKWDRGILPLDTLDLLENERGEKIHVSRSSTFDWDGLRELIKETGMRNSNCIAIAPTATTANIVGCIPTIEPIYKNLYVKSNQAGEFTIINPYLVKDLKELNLWNQSMLSKIKYYDGSIKEINEIPDTIKDKYREVFEIDPRWLIKSAAYRGKWIDQSQSLNIFFSGTSGRELSNIYMYAWEMGLKTTYYLRTLGASQVEKSTIDAREYGVTHLRKQGMIETTTITATIERPKEVKTVSAVKEHILNETDNTDCEVCQA